MATVTSGGAADQGDSESDGGGPGSRIAARLVDAAIDCIDQLGYGRVTTAEVALRAGVTQAEQYRLFPTRADLMAAVAHAVVRRWADAVEHPRPGGVIDLSTDPREAWRLFGTLRWDDRLRAEGHVWQELMLACNTDSLVKERMRDLGGVVARVALAEMRRLPGSERVPDDVLLGVGVTVVQMRETGRTYLELNSHEVPGLAEALRLMVDNVCDRYGIGPPSEQQPSYTSGQG